MRQLGLILLVVFVMSGAIVVSQVRSDEPKAPAGDEPVKEQPADGARRSDEKKPADEPPAEKTDKAEAPAGKASDKDTPEAAEKKTGDLDATAEKKPMILEERKDRPGDFDDEKRKTGDAAEKKPDDKPADDDRPRRITDEGKFLVGVYAGYGFIYPSGLIAGTGDQSADMTNGYAYGGELGYMILESGGIVLGVEYASKPVSVSRTYMRIAQQVQYQLTFIDYVLTYRGFFDVFDSRKHRMFAEAGFFYGTRSGKWIMRETSAGTTFERDMSSLRPGKIQNEWGLCFGGGFMFGVTSSVSVNVGLRLEISLQNAFEFEDEIKTNLAMLTVGATYKFKPF